MADGVTEAGGFVLTMGEGMALVEFHAREQRRRLERGDTAGAYCHGMRLQDIERRFEGQAWEKAWAVALKNKITPCAAPCATPCSAGSAVQA